jgi:hypothetical protein
VCRKSFGWQWLCVGLVSSGFRDYLSSRNLLQFFFHKIKNNNFPAALLRSPNARARRSPSTYFGYFLILGELLSKPHPGTRDPVPSIQGFPCKICRSANHLLCLVSQHRKRLPFPKPGPRGAALYPASMRAGYRRGDSEQLRVSVRISSPLTSYHWKHGRVTCDACERMPDEVHVIQAQRGATPTVSNSIIKHVMHCHLCSSVMVDLSVGTQSIDWVLELLQVISHGRGLFHDIQ